MKFALFAVTVAVALGYLITAGPQTNAVSVPEAESSISAEAVAADPRKTPDTQAPEPDASVEQPAQSVTETQVAETEPSVFTEPGESVDTSGRAANPAPAADPSGSLDPQTADRRAAVLDFDAPPVSPPTEDRSTQRGRLLDLADEMDLFAAEMMAR